jgi:hypothetical protein
MWSLLRQFNIWISRLQTNIKRTFFFIVFTCLLLFSILSILFLYEPPSSTKEQTESYSNENITVTSVICMYPVSGQYGRTSKYAYYVLTMAVVLLRKYIWLAAGAAATAMTYSGVAAIHAIVIFAKCNRLKQLKSHSYCDIIPMDGLIGGLYICAGVYDPDYNEANTIIGAGLLAALPMAAWSSTFHEQKAKAILLMWLLLLAIGHIVYLFTISNPNRHYQICPAGISEPPPASNYLAPKLYDQVWHQALYNISHGYSTTYSRACIYSCFDSGTYIGRNRKDIGLYNGSGTELDSSVRMRGIGIAFWFIYITFAAMALLVGQLRQRQIVQRGRSKGSYLIWNILTLSHKNILDRVLSAFWRHILAILEAFIRVFSAICFLGFVIYCEIVDRYQVFDESFDSVGQWGGIASILMVSLAAIMIRYMKTLNEYKETPSTLAEETMAEIGIGEDRELDIQENLDQNRFEEQN